MATVNFDNYAEFKTAERALLKAIEADSWGPIEALSPVEKSTLTGDIPHTAEDRIIRRIVAQSEGKLFFKNYITAREEFRRIQAQISLELMVYHPELTA